MEITQANLQDFILSVPPTPAADPTVVSVEEGIRRAELLLANDVMAATRADEAAAGGLSSSTAPLSAGRRKQILRGLANERVGVRGYASHRERKLTAPSPTASAGAARAQPLGGAVAAAALHPAPEPGTRRPSSRSPPPGAARGGVGYGTHRGGHSGGGGRPPVAPQARSAGAAGVAPAADTGAGPGAPGPGLTSTDALQSAAAAMVDSAIAKALAEGDGGAGPAAAAGERSWQAPEAAGAAAAAPRDAGVARGGGAAAQRGHAAAPAPTAAPSEPAARGGSRGNRYRDPAARDALIEQLLAERRRRKAGGGPAPAGRPPAGHPGTGAARGTGGPAPGASRGAAPAAPAPPAAEAWGEPTHLHRHTHTYVPAGTATPAAAPAASPAATADEVGRGGGRGASDASRSFLSPSSSPITGSAARYEARSGAAGHEEGAPGTHVRAVDAPSPGRSGGLSRPGDSRYAYSSGGSPANPGRGGGADWDRDSLDGDAKGEDGEEGEGAHGPRRGRSPGRHGRAGSSTAGARREGTRGTDTSRTGSGRRGGGGSSGRRSPRPSAASSKPRRRPGTARARDGRLYKRRSLEDLRRQQEANEMKECTFKPKINDFPTSRRVNTTREQRLERLARAKTRAYEQRQKLKAELEEKQAKECTFAPQINPQSRNYLKFRSTRKNITERLHKEADRRAEQRAKAKREMEQAEVENFPFRPVINPDTHAILDLSGYKPIHERVGDLQRAKNENLLRLRLERQQRNPDLTFRPQICEESEKLATKRREEVGEAGATVTERLSREAAQRERERIHRRQAWEAKVARDHRFQPSINENSERIVAQNPTYRKGFVSRQKELYRQQQLELQAVAERVQLENDDCTFKPSIGNATEVLVATRPARLGEDADDMVERLATKDRKRIAKTREQMRTKYYSQFSYKPQLDARSRRIGKATSVEEHVADERRKKKIAKLKAAAERRETEECTFVPTTTKAPRFVEEYREENGGAVRFQINPRERPEEVTKKIQQYNMARAKKIRKTKRELEYEEQRACTFAPETNKGGRPTAGKQKQVVVRGLGRFLELKEMAKRLEKEQEDRERKAFEVRGVPSTVPTVPEPFNLHSDTHSAARARKVLRDQEELQRQQCTFQPRTMESTKRALIQRLLREEEEVAASSRVAASGAGARTRVGHAASGRPRATATRGGPRVR